MAELSMMPVVSVAPVAPSPSSSQNQGSARASNTNENAEQPSFAHVLKERSNTNNNSEQKQPANAAPAEQAAAQAASANAPAQTEAARLLLAMTLTASNDPATDGTAGVADPSVGEALGTKLIDLMNGKSSKTTDAATDANAQASTQTDAAQFLANSAVMAVKIAPETATIADKNAQSTELRLTLDKQPYDASALSARAEQSAITNSNALIASNAELITTNHSTHANSAINAFATQMPAPQTTSTQHTVTTPVGMQGWADEVGQKLTWTASQDNGKASLILTPPQLGRVEVSINVTGDQATANFVAASPAAREALQDAMPRLRELLAQVGIQLGQTDVSTGQSGQPQGDAQGSQHGAGRTSSLGIGLTDADSATTRGSWVQQGRGMIDTFA